MSALIALRRLSFLINRLPYLNKVCIAKGNTLKYNGALLLHTSIKCKGKNNHIEFSGGGIIKTKINGDNNKLIIGNNSFIQDANFNFEDSGNLVSIGSDTRMCGKINIAAVESSSIYIGDNCLFSAEIEIRTSDSHAIYDMSGHRINSAKNIKIGNYVWVGQRVFILKGAQIGNGSVVGAAALVNKKFEEERCIIAGNPAHIVKKNILWDKDRKEQLFEEKQQK